MRKIEAVIFDWAGTMVDYGCFAPQSALMKVMKSYNMPLNSDALRLREEMCTVKGIKEVVKSAGFMRYWKEGHDERPTNKEWTEIYAKFLKELKKSVLQFAGFHPYVSETIRMLKARNVKIGSTTSYPADIVKGLQSLAKKQGCQPACCAVPDKFGRPYPYMLFENMKKLNILSVENVIKVGDSTLDILEGKNAGIFSIGVVEGSYELGCTKEAYEAMPIQERHTFYRNAEEKFRKAGADLVIASMKELPDAIRLIEKI